MGYEAMDQQSVVSCQRRYTILSSTPIIEPKTRINTHVGKNVKCNDSSHHDELSDFSTCMRECITCFDMVDIL